MLRINDCVSFKDPVGRVYKTDEMVLSLGENARIYTVTDCNQYVFVRFIGEDSPLESIIRQMCDCSSDEMAKANVLWPERVCYQLDDDLFCGFLARRIDIPSDLTLLNRLISPAGSSKVNMKDKLARGLNLARCIRAVHETSQKYIIGAPEPRDFHVTPDGCVLFCRAYRCALNTDDPINSLYVAPEYKAMQCGLTPQGDAFSFAVILFELLTGKFPFGAHEPEANFDNDQIADMILNGESIYYYENLSRSMEIDRMISAISPDLSRLFRRTFDYCGQNRYDEYRPSITEWIAVLENTVEMAKQ